jgi:hypothetical protein
LLLDDYAVCAGPRADLIARADQLLRQTPDAGMFALSWYPAQSRSKAAEEIDQLTGCPILLQGAIWRRDWFMELAEAVNPKCSPWGFESLATQAAKKQTRKIFAADSPPGCSTGSGRLIDGLDKSAWPLPYHNLMHRGQWAAEHVSFLISQGIPVPSRGLGDTIAKAIHAAGLGGSECGGCRGRQEKLNALLPFGPRQ